MKAKKTIVCRIIEPNKGKLKELEGEYRKVKELVELEKRQLDFLPLYKKIRSKIYSATLQAMDKYRNGDEDWNWYLRNDTFKVEKAKNTKEFDYWAKIPVNDVYGGVEVPIKPHTEITEDMDIKDSKIVRKDYGFELHLSVSKEVEPKKEYNGVLGIDLGLNKLAVSVSLPNRQTHIYGSEVGNVQSRFYFLRRNCRDGYTRRKWDGREKNITDNICHQISRRIVDYANKYKLFIGIGDVDGVQNQDKGRKMNRKLHNFPHWKLREYIKYKAKWEGIEVIEVSEAYTSQRCSRCGKIGSRDKGRFRCDNCGLEIDADKNGAHNIGKRALGKFQKTSSECRGIVTMPKTTIVDQTSASQVCEIGGNP